VAKRRVGRYSNEFRRMCGRTIDRWYIFNDEGRPADRPSDHRFR
jgi:hypothetical protein